MSVSPKTLLEDNRSGIFSRELSWLSFNERVLDEAADPTCPLLERVKFLAIVSSNLEEFFMIRLAALFRLRKRAQEAGQPMPFRDGFALDRLLERIRLWVFAQKTRQAAIFEEIHKELRNAGLIIEDTPSPLAEEIFQERILPLVAPVRIPDGNPLPHVRGSKLYLLARHAKSRSLIELPPELPRMLIVKTKHIFFVDKLLLLYRDQIFKKQEVNEMFSFKVSRDAEIVIDDFADDILEELEEQIKGRDYGPIVRLEVDSLNLSDSVRWLQAELGAPPDTLYQLSLPLDLRALLQLHNIKRFKKLKYPYPEPKRPLGLPAGLSPSQFFSRLDKHEFLLHHPYLSFDPVVELVRNASQDPAVIEISQTLYRTSGRSPILEALMHAAQAGKKVTALVEIKARFDEANNIRWARALEKAGAHVIYSSSDLKAHAKLTYVARKVGKQVKQYVHVSTGNYHPRTARLYTDLAMLTTKPAIAADAKRLFEATEALERDDELVFDFKTWVVAPDNLHEEVVRWIDNEATMAKEGKPAGIRAKMNGLVEESVIEALYRASRAGVKVDLIVRGMCCLRPGVPGLSDNIRVRSIVDKYLEHSRILIFENGGNRKVWLSSADWMPRNFFRRIELAVPVVNPKMIDYLSNVVWNYFDRDNAKARECDSEGIYSRMFDLGDETFRSQFEFENLEVPNF